MTMPQRGLYAITQTDHKTAERIIDDVAAAIRGGAVLVQYRDKNPTDAPALARALLAVCQQSQVPLLINDDVELARAIGADGVHLGKDDGDITAARERLGAHAIIGVSCYDSVARAVSAQAQGADYVAFGRFFSSTTKPLAAPAQIATLTLAKTVITVPIVAIGGILPDNGGALLAAGADLLAVVGGVFDHPPEAAAAAYQVLFTAV